MASLGYEEKKKIAIFMIDRMQPFFFLTNEALNLFPFQTKMGINTQAKVIELVSLLFSYLG